MQRGPEASVVPQHLRRFTRRSGMVADPRVYTPSVGEQNLSNALARAEEAIVDARDRAAGLAREGGSSSTDAVMKVRRVRTSPVLERLAYVDDSLLQRVADGLRGLDAHRPAVTATVRTQDSEVKQPAKRAEVSGVAELREWLSQQQRVADRYPMLPIFSRSERKHDRHLAGATRVIKLATDDSIIDAVRGTFASARINMYRRDIPELVAKAVYISRAATAFDSSRTLRAGEEHILNIGVIEKLAKPVGAEDGYSFDLRRMIDQFVYHSDLLGPIPADKLQLGSEILLELNRLQGKEGGLHYLVSTAPLGKYSIISKERKKPGKFVPADNLPRSSFPGTFLDIFLRAPVGNAIRRRKDRAQVSKMRRQEEAKANAARAIAENDIIVVENTNIPTNAVV